MDTVLLVSKQRHWTSDAFKTECREWFSLLLKAVEIKQGVENTLRNFLGSGKAVTVDKDYRPHIETEVHICMSNSMDRIFEPKLNVQPHATTVKIFVSCYKRGRQELC